MGCAGNSTCERLHWNTPSYQHSSLSHAIPSIPAQRVCESWNSTGPIPTLGMRLSCNFVNVYTIAYCIQYTCLREHARIPNGHPREDVRVGVGVGVVEFQLITGIPWCRHRHGHRLRLAQHLTSDTRDFLARKSMSVSVSVSAPWNASLSPLGIHMTCWPLYDVIHKTGSRSVHNVWISQCYQRRTDSHGHGQMGNMHSADKIWWSLAVWFSSYVSKQTDRHTHHNT